MDIQDTIKDLKAFVFILAIHFVDADGQGNAAHPGLDRHIGIVEGSGGTSAGIFHIRHGNAFKAHFPQGYLAWQAI